MNGTTSQEDASLSSLTETLEKFSAIVGRLKAVKKIDKKALELRREAVPRMGREEARLYLWEKIKQACNVDIYEDVQKLIVLFHQSYEQFKGAIESRYSTHRYITEQALGVIGMRESAISEALLEYCTFPDDPTSDMQDLIFEGHFYGDTSKGAKGNFINNLFKPALPVLEVVKKVKHGFDEDIQEHALMNFARNYKKAGKSSQGLFFLGVASHYLQDLTAPHHVGNYPAVPYVDHYFFEKYASQYVHGNPHFSITSVAYDGFKGSLANSLSDPEAFAKEISERASQFVPYIQTSLHAKSPGTDAYAKAVKKEIERCSRGLISGSKQWEQAIDNTVPLAVYATAYLFETALS